MHLQCSAHCICISSVAHSHLMSADSLYLKHTRTHTLTHTHTHTHKFTDELQVYGKDVALRISNDADSLSRALSLSLTHTRTQLIDELQLHGKEAAMCIPSVADSIHRPATTCFPRFQICYTNKKLSRNSRHRFAF